MDANFSGSKFTAVPFPHVLIPQIIDRATADRLLEWMQSRAPWTLRRESFYEQYEFSLFDIDATDEVKELLAPGFVDLLRETLRGLFSCESELCVVDAVAHLLRPGQTIRIHNDYLGSDETHRLLIQLNTGWHIQKGGLLMLFGGKSPDTLTKTILPMHGSGFAFEISETSFHAVSSISEGERFTIVYTYRSTTVTGTSLARAAGCLSNDFGP